MKNIGYQMKLPKVIELYLCEKLDINNYSYFLSCEEENISVERMNE